MVGKESLLIQYMILLRSLWKFLYFNDAFNIILILPLIDSIGPFDILLPFIMINELRISVLQFFNNVIIFLN